MKSLILSLIRTIPSPVRKWVRTRLTGSAVHRFYSDTLVGREKIYTQEYYTSLGREKQALDQKAMADALYELLSPKRVIDIGCGAAHMLTTFREHGAEVQGADFLPPARDRCAELAIPFTNLDLSRESDRTAFLETADLAVCLEVAEHLPKSQAKPLVQFLCRVAPHIAFSAAPPGQGGSCHYNEQPADYWIALFQEAGCEFRESDTRKLKERWHAEGIDNPRVRNFLLFRRDE